MAFPAPASRGNANRGNTKQPSNGSTTAHLAGVVPIAAPPPTVGQYSASAVSAMRTLQANECPVASRAALITKLLRDIGSQRLEPTAVQMIVKGLVESVRNGYVPAESINSIANVALGEMQAWSIGDRAYILRDFLVAIADLGHSDLLRSAITVSTIRLLEGFPEPPIEIVADLTLWLGYALVRNRIPQQLRDGVVRVGFAALRNTAITKEIRGKIAWVLSTLTDIVEFPYLPVEEILQFGDCAEVPEKLREHTKNNLNRRVLMSVGYF